MSTSSTIPGGGEEPFDAEEFARATIRSIETGDAYAGVLEQRVIRIEECICAPWYRRWILWRRLRREIRASVATWDPEYIPRGDFRARRLEAASREAEDVLDRQNRTWRERQAEEDAEGGEQGGAEPGEGFLP